MLECRQIILTWVINVLMHNAVLLCHSVHSVFFRLVNNVGGCFVFMIRSHNFYFFFIWNLLLNWSTEVAIQDIRLILFMMHISTIKPLKTLSVIKTLWNIFAVKCESNPPAACGFLTFFDKRLRILHQFFTHLLYVPIYARLQTFIQLSQTLMKSCHIKRDYLVQIICSKCPPSVETHTFKRLRKSLLIVVCGKSCQICCVYDVNKHVGYDMTSTVTSFAQ